MHCSHVPETIRCRIEFVAGKACRRCGRSIDGETLLRHLDAILARVALTAKAVFEFSLQQLCHECHDENDEGGGIKDENSSSLATLAGRRRAEVRDYFANAPARIIGNAAMREPQVESYKAIRDYFAGMKAEAQAPALVEIPTGCGKTGIICAAPYGIARGRVLIILPNLTIKRNLVKSMAPFHGDGAANRDNFFLKCGIFEDARDLPKFVVLERDGVNHEDCLRADVVITNIQQMQSWLNPRRKQFESDFFDMIIVDEAHHEPADSWQRVNQAFPLAKKVYLTATPFRCDSKAIVGQTIYRYRLANAIQEGYVKNVMRVDAIASRMTFTMQDEVREFSYDEILSMREEGWFSKGVALSEVSNATIIDRSIAIWKRKRASGVPHQIIGAACSIRHAIQIVEQYNERGVRTTHVASEGMTMEERGARIAAYENGDFDCIVHVGILGEGYDHPNISVAAIFRPYRSLSPYAQFVGRTIRWIRGASREDNLAHVVSHVGLNLGFLWEYYKHETREAAILSCIDQFFFNDAPPPLMGDEVQMELELEAELAAEVTGEEIEGFDIDTFLPIANPDIAYIGPTVKRDDIMLATFRGRGFREHDQREARHERSRDEQARLFDARSRGGESLLEEKAGKRGFIGNLTLPFNRPDLERKQQRQLLSQEVRRAAGYILFHLGIPNDPQWVAAIGEGDERNPYEAVISAVNRALVALLGKNPKTKRNDWSFDELAQARQLLREARALVLGEMKRKLDNRQHQLPF